MEQMLTAIQNHFWMIHQLNHTDTAYNIISAVKICGPLDNDRLIQAWQTAVQPPLVTSIDLHKHNGDTPYAVHRMDCRDESEAVQQIHDMANQKFALTDSNERPYRVSLLKVHRELHFFVLIQHHIITDLHCKNLTAKRISDAYNKGTAQEELTPYCEELPGDARQKQRDFWSKYLHTPPDPLILPGSEPIRTPFSGRGGTVFNAFDSSLSQKIERICEERNQQPFLLFLTVYSILIHKLSGQTAFLEGIPFPNRRLPGRNSMAGPFVNILPLRAEVKTDQTMAQVYQHLRKQMLLLHRHQELPFPEIASFYKTARSPEIPHMLQAGFTQEPPFSLQLDGMICEPLDIRPEGAQMDLFLTWWKTDDVFRFRWEFNGEAFAEPQIRFWSEAFESVLNQFLDDHSTETGNVSFPTSSWLPAQSAFYKNAERDYRLRVLFRNHLIDSYRQYHDRYAVCDDQRRLRFSEFSGKVKTYAAYFSQRAAGQNIAVLMTNSLERLAVIHGIVCSGNAYLPVNPMWPKQRIEYLLSNAGAVLTVTAKDLLDRLPADSEPVLAEQLQKEPVVSEFPHVETEPESAIALLYTSGSTGNPKGVIISGKGIVNRLSWMQETYPLQPGDRLIHKVPYTFDVSMWEIFWPFLAGAELYIPDPKEHLNDQYLLEKLIEQKISYVHFVPSLLNKFLAGTSDLPLPDLRGIICSGEALEPATVRQTFQRFPKTEIHNLYGPTEASIDVTAWTCRKEDSKRSQIPIGYPIANTRILILNDSLQICPPWVRGEIAIAGVNLASGYINNEEETSRRFVSGDWGSGHERIYLTGDTGYMTPSMYVEYTGRKDFQVKINGIRIELGEIEKHLEQLNGIRKALVLHKKESSGLVRLFAFLIPSTDPDQLSESEKSQKEEQLRSALREVLPGFMIPETFTFLCEYPCSDNGKIDRKSLLALKPDPVRKPAERHERIEDTSSAEMKLRKIWLEILHVQEIDHQINFFDAGGHSMLLPELKSVIENTFSLSLSLTDLFKYPTIKSQVDLVRKTEPHKDAESNSAAKSRAEMQRTAMRKRNIRKRG